MFQFYLPKWTNRTEPHKIILKLKNRTCKKWGISSITHQTLQIKPVKNVHNHKLDLHERWLFPTTYTLIWESKMVTTFSISKYSKSKNDEIRSSPFSLFLHHLTIEPAIKIDDIIQHNKNSITPAWLWQEIPTTIYHSSYYHWEPRRATLNQPENLSWTL